MKDRATDSDSKTEEYICFETSHITPYLCHCGIGSFYPSIIELQNLLKSTPKTIQNIELKLDIIFKINLGNVNSYDEYSKFIIYEVLRLRDKGYTYPEIVSNFKDRGIRSRRNRGYYKNLLVNMMYKYRKKKRRESNKIYNI